MKTLIACVLFSASLLAQSPGIVTVTGQVAATAGTVSCTGKPGEATPKTVDVSCTVNGTLSFATTVSPPVGSTSGVILSCGHNGDNVTLMLKQPTAAGPVEWSVTANGTMKSGTL